MNQASIKPILVAPALALFFGVFVYPTSQLLLLSVDVGPADSIWVHFQKFFVDDYYSTVAWRTVRIALMVSTICALIGFPLAYAISKARPGVRSAVLMVTVLPLLTSVVIRTFGWMILFNRAGPVSNLLQDLGISARASVLLHTETGLIIAMTQLMLPFMVLTTLGVIVKMNPNLEEASRTMGAGFYRTLGHVVLPNCIPGIVSGVILVFSLTVSSFVTPNFVGGVRSPMMAGAIYQQVTKTFDWNFAAAQSTLLLAGVLILLIPFIALTGKRDG